MGGHDKVNHGIYQMEWVDIPRGVLISAQFEGTGREPKRTERIELQRKARKIGIALTHKPNRPDGVDPNAEPLILLSSESMEPLALMETAQQLTGKIFPGVVTIVPCET